MSYFAYILKSEYDGTFYYGSTKNLQERLKIHNSGKSKYTNGRRPWKIYYFEEYSSRSEATQRKSSLKVLMVISF